MSNEAPREPHGLFVERFRLEATPHGYRLERRGVPQPSAPADRVARPAAPWLFVGRSAELEAARDVLRDGAMRGIVFYGARGCGKTTFLQALANDPGFAERFDAIAFVSACGQPLDDVLVLLNRALCEASDERFVPADGRWLAQLGSRRVALLIDDAEPPFDFDPIVRAAPGITLVATACEPPSHPALRTCEFSPLAGDDGVTLLGAVLGVEPNPRDAALMLCQSLRGNPGRIAQAAALCASTGIALEELARQLLSEATLDDALDARVALLDSDHRRLFDALALFGEPAISLSDPLLRELAESGLIVRDERGWCPSAGLGRRYGAARIDDESFGSTLVSARGRFLAAVEQLADPMHLLPSLAALRRAESLGRNEDAIVLGCAVADAFARTGAWRQWLGALEFVQRSAKRAGRAEDEAWALHQIGTRAAALGDIVGGMGTLRTALAMREEAGDRAAVAVTRHNVGLIEMPAQPAPPPPRHSLRGIGVVGALVGAVAIGALVPLAFAFHPHRSSAQATPLHTRTAGARAHGETRAHAAQAAHAAHAVTLAQPDITAGRPTVRAVPSTIARVVVRAPRPAHTLAAVPVPTRSPPARAATATLAPKSPLAAKQVALRGAAAVAVPPHAPVPPQILSFRLLRSGLTSVGTLCLQVAHAQRVAVHASPGGEVPLPVAAASGVRVCTHVRPHSNTRYELEAQGDGWQSFREVVAIENSPSHR